MQVARPSGRAVSTISSFTAPTQLDSWLAPVVFDNGLQSSTPQSPPPFYGRVGSGNGIFPDSSCAGSFLPSIPQAASRLVRSCSPGVRVSILQTGSDPVRSVGSEGRRGRWGTPTMALHTYSIESRLIMRVKVWAPWLDYESDESDASTTRRLSAAHRWSHLMAPPLEPLSPRTQKGGDRSQKGGPPFPPRRLSRGPASPGSSDAGCLPADFGDSPTQGQTRSGPNRGFHRVKYFC